MNSAAKLEFTVVDPQLAQWSVDAWVAAIDRNDYATIARHIYKDPQAFRYITPEVISKAYKLHGFAKTTDFISRLPWLLHWALAYKTLFNEMMVDNVSVDHLRLGRMVKNALEMNNEAEVKRESRPYFEYVNCRLPDGIKRLVWNKYISLETRAKLESCTIRASYKGLLGMCSHSDDDAQKWYLEYQDPNGVYVRLLNKKTGMVLCAEDSNGVFASKPEEKKFYQFQYWRFVPNNTGTLFHLENRIESAVLHNQAMHGHFGLLVMNPTFTGTPEQMWNIL